MFKEKNVLMFPIKFKEMPINYLVHEDSTDKEILKNSHRPVGKA